MTREITPAEQDALALLASRGRIMVVLVPDDVPDGFVAGLTAWSNFALDTRLKLPLTLPVARKGDGLVCPYCGVAAATRPELHLATCDWRQAIERWTAASFQIEAEFGAKA